MSYPTYPGGYMYPNELVVRDLLYPTPTWLPMLAVYTILISIAAGSALLLGVGVLLDVKVVRRVSPILLMISLATGLSFPLAPLADLTRPERGVLILLYPHIIPSSTHPGISLIAFVITIMLPALILLLLITGYYAIYRGAWASTVTKVVALLLSIVALAWTMYFSMLMFTTMPNLAIFNLIPMLPAEHLLESIAVASSITLLAFTIHNRGVLEVHLAKTLSLIALGATGGFTLFRLIELLRLYIAKTGSPEIETFMTAFSSLNAVALILAIISGLLAYHVYTRGSLVSAILLAVATLAWILSDRFLIAVNIQAISKTGLSIIPFKLGYTWILESIGIVLIALFIYYVTNTWILRFLKIPVILKVEGEGR